MTLDPGARLGPYEIVAPLGAGGMGEVYRARDARLGRDVAVKVLPAHLSADPALRARFEREARAVAALNHPNICTLHDVGREGDVDFLVMELVDGESLAERVAKGPLPLADVLRFGAQIADALEKAHRAGIVHRDLKPANVMLTRSGAKLMDFGLARSGSLGPAADVSQSPTMTRALTAEGHIVGTFQYMAPEQLEGAEADARSDLWALGCVLYEMASGRRPFEGKSQASLIGVIMNVEPAPLSQIAPMSPQPLERLVRACLTKDPDERLQTAHDAKLQLQWIAESPSQGGGAAGPTGEPASRTPPARTRPSRASAIVIAGLAAACAVLALLLARDTGEKPRLLRVAIPAPPQTKLQLYGAHPGPPVLSPDGRMLAFVGRAARGEVMLWVRSMDSDGARVLLGTESAGYPFWSPDGRSIAFFSTGKLRRVDVGGGPPVTICDAPFGKGGTWSREGFILFAPGNLDPIHRVPSAGGESQAVTQIDSTRDENSHRFPVLLPDGRHFLYYARIGGTDATAGGTIMISSLDGKSFSTLMRSQSQVEYASGHLIFARDRVLMAQSFDPRAVKLSGEPFPIAESVHVLGGAGYAVFSVAANGVLAYLAPMEQGESKLLVLDRSGAVVDSIGYANFLGAPELSPDGKTCVVAAADLSTGLADLWLYDLVRHTERQFTFDAANQTSPIWSPDGSRIVYRSGAGNSIAITPVSGSAPEETFFQSSAPAWPLDWSADGQFLVFETNSMKTRLDVWVLPLAGDRKAYHLFDGPANENEAKISPDGNWITYMSTESGRQEVYATSFPSVGRKWQISSAGGNVPRWRPDGGELFYLALESGLVSVPVQSQGADLVLERGTLLFDLSADAGFDVFPDGNRFLVIRPDEKAEQPPISLVVNWTAGLQKR